jgi:cytochrome c556
LKARRWCAIALAAGAAACGSGENASVAGGGNPDAMLASGMTARQAVEARSLHMKDLGGSFKSVKDQLTLSSPNLALVRAAAAEVRTASDDLASWFPAGTGPETGLEMRSLREVWTDAPGFARAAESFRGEAKTLAEVAQGTDTAAMASQAQAVGRTCAGCHDGYRAEEE